MVPSTTIVRPAVEADLDARLRPNVFKKYAVVVGASGTGKSTAMRKAVRRLAQSRPGQAGVAYFSAPESVTEFSQGLAEELGFFESIVFVDVVRRWLSSETKEAAVESLKGEPRATWSRLKRVLKAAAALYKAAHGFAPTLVLDAMDRVAKQDGAFFLLLQEFAKTCADDDVLHIVFVFSDGAALPLLLSSSATSRCGADQIYEIGEVDDTDAVRYVVARFQRDEFWAQDLVATVTGGRFSSLELYGDSQRDLSEIRAVIDDAVLARLKGMGVPATHALFGAVLARAPLHRIAALELLSEDDLTKLLSANILAAHPNGTYTFGSRRVAVLMREAHEKEARELEARGKEARKRWLF
jgi:hypothetical protein